MNITSQRIDLRVREWLKRALGEVATRKGVSLSDATAMILANHFGRPEQDGVPPKLPVGRKPKFTDDTSQRPRKHKDPS